MGKRHNVRGLPIWQLLLRVLLLRKRQFFLRRGLPGTVRFVRRSRRILDRNGHQHCYHDLLHYRQCGFRHDSDANNYDRHSDDYGRGVWSYGHHIDAYDD